MTILHTEIYKLSIPTEPFKIATGTMHFLQNTFIRVYTDTGMYGVGECSAFPMIVGETQTTCFEMAKEFAAIWKGKDATDIPARMQELHAFTAFNATIKSAFDMALYDLKAKAANQPLYRLLGGQPKLLETDLTIGIDTPAKMAEKAIQFKKDGVRIIKIKLGVTPEEDIERVEKIRQAVGPELTLRVDANQGWDFNGALKALNGMAHSNVQFCEQPMRTWYNDLLPKLRQQAAVKIMADESVFNHHDARQLINAGACDYINIKFAKSGGFLEATEIIDICEQKNIPCMMGGMLESRVALTAFAHFALAHDTIQFYDMDTCLLGQKMDPVKGGVRYNGYFLEVPDTPGLGVDVDQDFLDTCESCTV
ncbi:mandelate racemase/muconate lactonizing enzyme family protein [Filimonas effusa]|uniref:Dipeptide epimerase n=1 Tax=Filimonas effusa TaxID=2508721 RepID=A0A4Q1DCL3_9BACT|nr:dipeptide epimerase [Filimonas effusa]RXK86279.1 dipeptide epimerase [Filimonas effusa]